MSKGMTLLVSDSYGRYVPQQFARNFDCVDAWEGISNEELQVLLNPDHEEYWETWDDVTRNATKTTPDGVYRLYQDGDLWAYCEALLTPDEREFLGYEESSYEQ